MTAAIGNGTAPTVTLPNCPLPLTPLPLIKAVSSLEDLIDHAYPALEDCYASVTNALLAGTNERIDHINSLILNRLPGEMQHLYSADSCEDDEGQTLAIPTETLATCTDVGIPPHDLELKPNCLAIIVRNLNFGAGLCNSTKVIVREVLPSRRLIRVEVNLEGQYRLTHNKLWSRFRAKMGSQEPCATSPASPSVSKLAAGA